MSHKHFLIIIMLVVTDVVCWVVVKCAVQAKVGKILHHFIGRTKISNLHMIETKQY